MNREEAMIWMVNNPEKKVKFCSDTYLVIGISYTYSDGKILVANLNSDHSEISHGMPEGEYEIVKQKVKKEIEVWISQTTRDLRYPLILNSKNDGIYDVPVKLIVEVEE